MKTPEECRLRANECMEWSRKAANQNARAVWVSMAQYWLERAESGKTQTGQVGQIPRMKSPALSKEGRDPSPDDRAGENEGPSRRAVGGRETDR